MFYLYRHIRLDKNTPFYIGIGKHRRNFHSYERAHYKTNRTKHWKNIVNKAGYRVEIMLEVDSLELIMKKEKEFIALYGRKVDGGILVNLTTGGDGSMGHIVSNEVRERLSLINTGAGHPQYGKKASSETRAKQSEAKTGARNTSSKRVLCINNNIIYESQGEAALDIYGSRNMSKKISDIIHGKRKSYCGYIFRRVKDFELIKPNVL